VVRGGGRRPNGKAADDDAPRFWNDDPVGTRRPRGMRRWVLEHTLSNMCDIEAAIGYRLAPDAPCVIIATFTDRRDAEVFMGATDRSQEVGTYTLILIED
jgi:hypothetical protein